MKKTETSKPKASARAKAPKASAKAPSPRPKKVAASTTADKVVPSQFTAHARYVWYSPYKLRLLADIVRGKDVTYALQWLTTYRTRRAEPIKKTIESAVANAKNLSNVDASTLTVKEIRIDQGPTHRYFKPSAMGRSMPLRKRLSHISVILGTK